ncbi:EamA/RhaT family transporter, partial [Mesorhizobium sp. M1A.F.Ca.IN.022.04.1.1]
MASRFWLAGRRRLPQKDGVYLSSGPILSVPKNYDDSATPPAAMLLMLCVYVCFTFLDTSS